MSSWIPNLVIIILTLLSAGRALKTLIDTTGEQRVSEIGNAALILPNTTELGSLNILQELTALRGLVETLQNQTTQMQTQITLLENTPATPSCSWTGLGCDCHLDASSVNDAAILIGSQCTNGTLQWVKILQAVHSDSILVSCQAIVNASVLATCDVMF